MPCSHAILDDGRLECWGDNYLDQVIPVPTAIVEDLPIPGIVGTAHDVDADLIVCGTRGRGRVKELVLGSVARELPEKSHLPVTIVPPR